MCGSSPHPLTPDQARSDWARLVGPRGVDLVGWQEAATPVFRGLAAEYAGASAAVTAAPFPSRWVVTVRLRHRDSGRTVTLLNTHVNQTTETGQRFERNLDARRVDGVVPTRNTRWIDHVWLAAESVRRRTGGGTRGPAQLAAQRTLDGFESDHRPLWVGVRLDA